MIDTARVRNHLKACNLKPLFIEELGWDSHGQSLPVTVDSRTVELTAVAQKRGMVVFLLDSGDDAVPDYATRRKIEHSVAKSVHEHIIIYVDGRRTTQIWQWVRRQPGKPAVCREQRYYSQQSGEALVQRLRAIAFTMEEEEDITLPDVTGRTRAAFDVDRVTKKFYDQFKTEHSAFLKFLKGIPDEDMQRWHASVMINRLMFIYFIQKKGFLDGDPDYLGNKLAQIRAAGKDRYYRDFLCPLFFEGFAKKESDRSPQFNGLLGRIPYLNGGIFQRHQLEELHGKTITIADAAFERIFSFFNQYHWHLDERPLRADYEINPDVLGYIFEKYINQKQMGAYYTREDITGYISQNTVIPRLFDMASTKCRIAFERIAEGSPDTTIWGILQAEPERYVYDAVRKGAELLLPKGIAEGLKDISKRTQWNRPAPEEYALPTETWREVVARRQHYEGIWGKLLEGRVHDINDLITYNLDIRQFAQDVIQQCEGPELLRAFWHAIRDVTVLDPTCGSGAFLFAALNVLEPLYEACLDRMEFFLDELDRSGEKRRPEKFSDFREVLAEVARHPNERYFILKSIILNNLYGVDIMEEAVEICKLRLFLKLVAQVDRVEDVEPLPDVDFNIRAGNTLVGFVNRDEIKKAMAMTKTSQGKMVLFDEDRQIMQRIEEKAEDVDRLFGLFRQMQTQHGMDSRAFADAKVQLRRRLKALEDELNSYLATEYGISPTRQREYVRWLSTHKPFHWFIEYFGIMRDGGFDVIIGNPPYFELGTLTTYRPLGFSCEDAGNIYALMLERCFALRLPDAREGFIVPVSSISADRYVSLVKMLSSNLLHYSAFDDRPSRLFDGLEHSRLAIHLIGKPAAHASLFSTRYHKWTASERDALFTTMRYAPASPALVNGSLPKLTSQTERAIIDRLVSQGANLGSFYVQHGVDYVFYSRKVGYFAQVLDFEPRVLDGAGNKRPPSEFKRLTFGNKVHARLALACLNSSLFYWFITVFSDCRHVNKRELDQFPVNLRLLASQSSAEELMTLVAQLMDNLSRTSEERVMSFRHDTLTVQCIIPKRSKSIIDEIDRVLGSYMGFTDEELDFIVNYDIKYRMGSDTLEEEDEE